MAGKKLTLHHLEYSQSFRILWLLEEMGQPYELKSYNRDPVSVLAPAEYKAISPIGTAPVITHGKMALAESSAIMDYLADLSPDCGLRPEVGSKDRTRYLFWFHTAQGSMMPILLMQTVLRMTTERVPFFLRPMAKMITGALTKGFIQPRLFALLDQAEADLSKKKYFGGSALSLADILIVYNIEGADSRGLLGAYPNLQDWLARMKARPAFQAATKLDDRPSMILPSK
tara:strand:- start:1069 stop:1755 length:687 start_codon:yes stop_codon:yes gene_type:complete